MMNEMPYDEFLKWIEYFKIKRPIGWKEDQRTYMIMATFGAKGNPESYFPSLKIMKERADKENKQKLPTGEWLNKMIHSKDGDHKWKPFWDNKNGKT